MAYVTYTSIKKKIVDKEPLQTVEREDYRTRSWKRQEGGPRMRSTDCSVGGFIREEEKKGGALTRYLSRLRGKDGEESS